MIDNLDRVEEDLHDVTNRNNSISPVRRDKASFDKSEHATGNYNAIYLTKIPTFKKK